MCTEPATADEVRAAMPHPAAGSAADPITLEPADDVIITTLVDNVYDALLTGGDTVRPSDDRFTRPVKPSTFIGHAIPGEMLFWS